MINELFWSEAVAMRNSGNFLKIAQAVQCPIVVIHGDFDPHPLDGIKKPLEKAGKHAEYIVLPKCGHTPWLEKFSAKQFYKILKSKLSF